MNQGQVLRAKVQLEALQTQIASVARKIGISSATELALIAPQEANEGKISNIECSGTLSSPQEIGEQLLSWKLAVFNNRINFCAYNLWVRFLLMLIKI